jgi:hypothetical protein
MHRPFVTCAAFLFACSVVAAGAQQADPAKTLADQYQGQSNPPADDVINVAPPEQPVTLPKPPAGHREDVQPAQAAPSATAPRPSSVDPSTNFPTAQGDDGIVQVAPDPEPDPDRDPKLKTRTTYGNQPYGNQTTSASSDPDGDIVHPAPLPPGVLAEGAKIRARLLTRLSTVDSQAGEAFRARVASDVTQDGNVLIPAGAEIEGHVLNVSSGSFGGHGSMRLQPETVILPDGSRFRLDAQVVGTPGSKTRVNNEGTINPGSRTKKAAIEYGGAVGAGAVVGAALGGAPGALAGTIIGASAITVHLLVDHPQAVLEPGTVLMFSLSQRLNLVSTDKAANERSAGESVSSEQ